MTITVTELATLSTKIEGIFAEESERFRPEDIALLRQTLAPLMEANLRDIIAVRSTIIMWPTGGKHYIYEIGRLRWVAGDLTTSTSGEPQLSVNLYDRLRYYAQTLNDGGVTPNDYSVAIGPGETVFVGLKAINADLLKHGAEIYEEYDSLCYRRTLSN